jgi:hypothetical protein
VEIRSLPNEDFEASVVRGSFSGTRKDFYSSPPHPDRLWGPPSLLLNVYRGTLPWSKAANALS